MTHAVMAVTGSSAPQLNGSAVLCFLQQMAWPVETAVVRLSEPDGVVFDSRRWTIGRRALAEIAREIEQYIADSGANLDVTILANRYELGWSEVTGRFLD